MAGCDVTAGLVGGCPFAPLWPWPVIPEIAPPIAQRCLIGVPFVAGAVWQIVEQEIEERKGE